MTTNRDAQLSIEPVAEEFAARLRRGERPSIEEYVDKYPQLTDEIRDLFPTMLMMEELSPHGDKAKSETPARPFTPAPDPQRLGEFRIIREIGRGGMGVVYEAVQETLGRKVALKVLPAHAAGDDSQRERFLREARAAAQLHHTNIVPVFAVGEAEGTPYFAMQYIRGQSLHQFIGDVRQANSGPLVVNTPPTEIWSDIAPHLAKAASASDPIAINEIDAANEIATHNRDGAGNEIRRDTSVDFFQSIAHIGIQAADALAYAHRHGILHRDIKPANLMIDSAGVVWIMDFGLAQSKGLENLTQSGDVVGTVRYLAPERFKGQATPRSDIYSLGLTLYELAARTPAYDDSDGNRLLLTVMRAEAQPLRSVAPRIPRDLETIIHKCIAREPSRRYTGADELADDLRRFVNGEPIQARRVGPAERLLLWVRRHPMPAALLAMSIVAVLCAAALLVYFNLNRQLHESLAAEQTAKQQEAAARLREVKARQNEQVARRRAEAAEARAKRGRFNNAVFLAQKELEQGNIMVARRLHASIPPTFRAWEWHYLRPLLHRESFVTKTRQFFPAPVHLSGDGRRLAWREPSTHFFHVVDVNRNVEIPWWPGRGPFRVLAGALSPDGNRVAVAQGLREGDKANVFVVDVDSRKMICRLTISTKTLARSGRIGEMRISPDGKRLAIDNLDGIIDIEKRQVQFKLQNARAAHHFAFDESGRWIAGCGGRRVFVWDGMTGRQRHAFDHGSTVGAVGFVDSNTLMSSSANVINTWDLRQGRRSKSLPCPKARFGGLLAFSSDGNYLCGALERTVFLWNARNGQLANTFRGAAENVTAIAFGHNDSTIVAGGLDNSIRLFLINATPHHMALKSGRSSRPSISFHPDGKTIAGTAADGEVKIWELDTGSEVKHFRLPAHVFRLRWTANGENLICGAAATTPQPRGAGRSQRKSGQLIVLDKNGDAVWSTKPEGPPISELAVSPRGRLLAYPSAKTALIYNYHQRKKIAALTHPGFVQCLAFNTDGKLLATGCADHRVRIWDPATGRVIRILQGHKASISQLAFHPHDNRLAVGDEKGVIKIWNADTAEPIVELTAHVFGVNALNWNPTGDRLISGAATDVVHVWDAELGQLLLSLSPSPQRRFSETIHDAAFSPCGRRIAAVCNGAITIYSIAKQ